MSTSAWCPLVNALVCLRAHARKCSGAAKTHTAEQQGNPQRGSRGNSHNQGPALACVLAPGESGTGFLHGQEACPAGSRFQLASCGGQRWTGLLYLGELVGWGS